jgi:hypothetical protein
LWPSSDAQVSRLKDHWAQIANIRCAESTVADAVASDIRPAEAGLPSLSMRNIRERRQWLARVDRWSHRRCFRMREKRRADGNKQGNAALEICSH